MSCHATLSLAQNQRKKYEGAKQEKSLANMKYLLTSGSNVFYVRNHLEFSRSAEVAIKWPCRHFYAHKFGCEIET